MPDNFEQDESNPCENCNRKKIYITSENPCKGCIHRHERFFKKILEYKK